MKKLVLPSPYLSYSQMSCWKKNKKQYRQIYYQKGPRPISKELVFGKELAKRMENKDPELAHIMQYDTTELRLLVPFEGFQFLAYLDSFDPNKVKFLDHKTGKTPWTELRVRQHEQLPIYSLLLQKEFGKVDDECHIVWLETRDVEQKRSGLSNKFDGCIELTGRVEVFPREIKQWERDRMYDDVITTAREIHYDYEGWRELHPVH